MNRRPADYEPSAQLQREALERVTAERDRLREKVDEQAARIERLCAEARSYVEQIERAEHALDAPLVNGKVLR